MIQFSVVIPLYNKEKYILRAIKSVFCQSYEKFECIVVDDGSTDNSLAIVSKIEDSRLVILSQPNGGVSSARNYGIEKAKNEYIALLDADDFWEPSFLENIKRLITEYDNLSLYFTSHFKLHNFGNRTVVQDTKLAPSNQSVSFDLFEYFQKHKRYLLPIHTSSTVIRKSDLLKVGCFDERISFFEDYALFVDLALNSRLAYLNIPLSTYDISLSEDEKITGKLPPLEKHWVNYIFDGKISKSNRYSVLYFQSNFAVWLMNSYRKIGTPVSSLIDIRKKVRFKLLTLKNKILYFSPSLFIKLLLSR